MKNLLIGLIALLILTAITNAAAPVTFVPKTEISANVPISFTGTKPCVCLGDPSSPVCNCAEGQCDCGSKTKAAAKQAAKPVRQFLDRGDGRLIEMPADWTPEQGIAPSLNEGNIRWEAQRYAPVPLQSFNMPLGNCGPRG